LIKHHYRKFHKNVNEVQDFFVSKQLKWSLGLLVLEILRSYAVINIQPIGFLCKTDRHFAEATNFTTRNKYNRRTYTFSAGFETAISGNGRAQASAVGRTVIPLRIYGLILREERGYWKKNLY
jgi:hypothetical protein